MSEIILTDPAAERAVLSGVFNYGHSAYYDVADIINENTFTIDSNGVIFKCLKHILEGSEDSNVIDMPSVFSAASELGLSHIFDKREEVKHLSAIIKFPIHIENVRKFAAKIRKLEVARLLKTQLGKAEDELSSLNGDERFSHI